MADKSRYCQHCNRKKRALRQLQKAYERYLHVDLSNIKRLENERDIARDNYARLIDHHKSVDYRSVCHCWTCRLGTWYRRKRGYFDAYHKEHRFLYPGSNEWRFPLARFWPNWK